MTTWTHQVVLHGVTARIQHDQHAEALAEPARLVCPVELARVVLCELVLNDDRPDEYAAEEREDEYCSCSSAEGEREAARVEEGAEERGRDDSADRREERCEGASADRVVECEMKRGVAPVLRVATRLAG